MAEESVTNQPTNDSINEQQQQSHERMLELENTRHKNQLELEKLKINFEILRLAKDVVFENHKTKPVDSRDMSSDDVKNFAEQLKTFINS